MHGLAPTKKSTNVHACFQFASNEILYMFCSSFEPFILEGFNKPWGYHILRLFSLVMLLGTVVVCFSSVMFVWSYKVIFSEK